MAPSLVELAGRFGIATDYDDWSGRRVGVPESTLIAVLAALGIPAADEAERNAARTAHERAHWSRALPPTILGQAGTQTTFWVHVTHGQPAEVWVVLEDGTVRTGIRQVDNFTPPFDLDGRLDRRSELRAARRLAAGLSPGASALRRRRGQRRGDRDTGLAWRARAAGRSSHLGIGHAVI